MKKILFVGAEAMPFAATGGLGDVMGSLPAAIKAKEKNNVDVRVVLPLYAAVKDEWREQMKDEAVFTVDLAWRKLYCGVKSLVKDGVTYYFIDNEYYFKRGALYGFFDDGERYAYFCKAVLEMLIHLEFYPDVIHANDWQSALAVIYLRTVFASHPCLSHIRTVFTVHNMAYQGKYDTAILSDVLDIHPIHRGILEYDGSLNLMKGALEVADRVTTVSPRYAEELRDPYYAEGLSDMVSRVADKTVGILNGIDTQYFDPRSLPLPYDAKSCKEGKARNKAALLSEMGLDDVERPLLVIISRLVADKGIDMLLDILPRLRALDVNLVVLGTGEASYEEALRRAVEENSGFMRAFLTFDRDLSKKLYAAADVFLMPSRREPCGLAQMVACRYGAVPVVCGTGGLHDTILPYGRPDGCGFVFRLPCSDEFFDAVSDAVMLYRGDRAAFDALSARNARISFGWHRSAKKYLDLYRELGEEYG